MLQASCTLLAWKGHLTCMGFNAAACVRAGASGEVMLNAKLFRWQGPVPRALPFLLLVLLLTWPLVCER